MRGRMALAASALAAALSLVPVGGAFAGAHGAGPGGAPLVVPVHGPGGPGYGDPGYGGPGYGGAEPHWHRQMHDWMARQGLGPGDRMAPGMMQGQGPVMVPGYPMGPGTMHGWGPAPGQPMGPGTMHGWGPMAGPGMAYGMQPPVRDLSVDDVRSMLELTLEWEGNPNLEVGSVEQADDGAIVAEIVTRDGSLVNRFSVDPATGRWMPAN